MRQNNRTRGNFRKVGTSTKFPDLFIFEFFRFKNFQKEINEKLEAILLRQVNMEAKMRNIGKTLTGLNVVSEDTKKLASQIAHTSNLAEKVSEKVRRLDEARVTKIFNFPIPSIQPIFLLSESCF